MLRPHLFVATPQTGRWRVQGVLAVDPDLRWGPWQALHHPFLTGEPFTAPYQPPPEPASEAPAPRAAAPVPAAPAQPPPESPGGPAAPAAHLFGMSVTEAGLPIPAPMILGGAAAVPAGASFSGGSLGRDALAAAAYLPQLGSSVTQQPHAAALASSAGSAVPPHLALSQLYQQAQMRQGGGGAMPMSWQGPGLSLIHI